MTEIEKKYFQSLFFSNNYGDLGGYQDAITFFENVENNLIEINKESINDILKKEYKDVKSLNCILHYLINRKEKYQEEELELITKIASKISVEEMMGILKRDDVTARVIEDIIDKYENKFHQNFSVYLIENSISNRTVNYLINYKTKETAEKWNYMPYIYYSAPDASTVCSELIKKEPFNEELMYAIASNAFLPSHIRDKAYDNGCNFIGIKNPTTHMSNEMYLSISDYLFDTDKSKMDKDTTFQALTQMEKLFPTLLDVHKIDLVYRAVDAGHYGGLLNKLAESTIETETELIDALLHTNILNVKNTLYANMPKTKELYDIFLPFLNTYENKQYCREMILNYEEPTKGVFGFLLNDKSSHEEDKKSLLLSPKIPRKILEKMKEKAEMDTKLLIEIREKLSPHIMTSSKYYGAYQKLVLEMMNHNSNIYKFMNNSLNARYTVFCQDISSAQHFFDIAEKVIEKHKKEKCINKLRKSVLKLKSIYEQEKFLLENNLPCIHIKDGMFVYDAEKVKAYTKEEIEDIKNKINNIDNPQTQQLIQQIVLSGIFSFGSKMNGKDILYMAYKSKDIFLSAEERKSDLEKPEEISR